LLPVLPDKSTAGLRQLNVSVEQKSLDQLLRPLEPGHALGQGEPLFPKVETKPQD
jgi:methionyl-tRNA synthetase